MSKLKLHTQARIANTHIIFFIQVGFDIERVKEFSNGINLLIETISFGGDGTMTFADEEINSRAEYKVKVVEFNEDRNIINDNICSGVIKVGFPIKMCNVEQGIPQLLSVLMYPSVYSFIKEYRVIDVEMPEKYLYKLPKSKYGLSIFDNNNLNIGLILKPRSILNEKIAKKLITNAVKAGIDYVTDDELTINPEIWTFKDRVSYIMNLLSELNKKYNRKVKYIANISGSYLSSIKLSKIASKYKVDGVMINTITMGYDVLHKLSSQKNFKPFIVANVIGRNMVSGGKDFLIAPHILSFFARIYGADAVYTGPFVGTISSRKEKSSQFVWALTDQLINKRPFKPVYAVMSGGLTPKNLLENWRIYSEPIMFSLGLSLAKLIEKDFQIEKVISIIRIIFNAEKIGGDSKTKEEIVKLASNDNYRIILKELGWFNE